MNQNGNPTGAEVAELDASAVTRHLKQQPWRQQYEQHHRYEHRSPIRHRFTSLEEERMICNSINQGTEE
ncbi:hypothetical protein RJ639_030024 [Escallonia herrerae]|uniref:Uncharacterized protein n=1 Tax=Escallonia herrerae TaxID=1293975 RepID=A0AA88XDP5_9ASTE|nr:hypothetical protein RJ639_030024 [Escallonia herrerae]